MNPINLNLFISLFYDKEDVAMNSALNIKMFSVTLDTNNAHELADFYAALLGWEKGVMIRNL